MGGRPDVEGEAVFGGAGVVEDHVGIAAGLDAVRAEVAGEEDAFPLADGLRRTPAELFEGRLGVGNAFVGDDFLVGSEDAEEFAVFDLDGARCERFLGGGGCGEEHEGAEEGCAVQTVRGHDVVSGGQAITDGLGGTPPPPPYFES
jgi:hypothetical protein